MRSASGWCFWPWERGGSAGTAVVMVMGEVEMAWVCGGRELLGGSDGVTDRAVWHICLPSRVSLERVRDRRKGQTRSWLLRPGRGGVVEVGRAVDALAQLAWRR
jgi:hypothetical protein